MASNNTEKAEPPSPKRRQFLRLGLTALAAAIAPSVLSPDRIAERPPLYRDQEIPPFDLASLNNQVTMEVMRFKSPYNFSLTLNDLEFGGKFPFTVESAKEMGLPIPRPGQRHPFVESFISIHNGLDPEDREYRAVIIELVSGLQGHSRFPGVGIFPGDLALLVRRGDPLVTINDKIDHTSALYLAAFNDGKNDTPYTESEIYISRPSPENDGLYSVRFPTLSISSSGSEAVIGLGQFQQRLSLPNTTPNNTVVISAGALNGEVHLAKGQLRYRA